MVVLHGKELNPWKRVWYALLAFDGIGLVSSKKICHQALIHPLAKVRDLNDEQVISLRAILQPRLESESQRRLLKLREAKRKPKAILPL